MKNYKELVSKFRELARDLLRMKQINNIKDDILTKEIEIGHWEKDLKSTKKEILNLEFKMSKLEDEDPYKEEKEKDYRASIEMENKRIEKLTEAIQKINLAILEKEKEIENVRKGEYKVDRDNLSMTARKLAEEWASKEAATFTLEENENDNEDIQ